MDMKLELVQIPVSDVDRAKAFYADQLGFHADHDHTIGDALATRNVLDGSTGPRPAPFTLEPTEAIRSLDRLEDVNATWVLPGHGPVWDGGVTEAVRIAREAAAVTAGHGS